MLSLQQKQVSYNVRRTFMTTAVRLGRRFVRGRCVHAGALRAVLLRDLNWQQRRRLTFMAGLYFRTFSTSEYKNRKQDEVVREWRWRLFPQTPPTHANFHITENINQFFRFPFLFTKYCFWNCSSSTFFRLIRIFFWLILFHLQWWSIMHHTMNLITRIRSWTTSLWP